MTNIETSLMVHDYPEPPDNTKEVSGAIVIRYDFTDIPVPKDWDRERIEEDIRENLSEYLSNADREIEEIDV